MSKYQLKIANKIRSVFDENEYLNFGSVVKRLNPDNTSEIYRVWDLMNKEGMLKQGYARTSALYTLA